MSNDPSGSDPAFPASTGSDGGIFQEGMTLRHWTATECLSISMSMLQMAAASGTRVELRPEVIAKNALILADCLIEMQKVIIPKNKPN